MRTLVVAAILLSSLLGTRAVAQFSVPVADITLIRATNYIQGLRSRAGPVTLQEVVVATAKSCHGLTELLKDETFRFRVQTTAAAANEHADASSAVRGSLGFFITEFLVPENELLARAGLDTGAIIQITKDALELRLYLNVGKLGPSTVPEFLKRLEVFKHEVCLAAQQAKTTSAKSQKEALDRLAYGVSGVAIIVVNTAAAKPTSFVSFASYEYGVDFFFRALR